jgi:UDP-N-acetylmuramate dehydrogenase
MTFPQPSFSLNLPDGRLRFGEPLAPYTTIGIGGRTAVLAEAHSREELVAVRAEARRCGLRTIVLGGGSNVAFADGELCAAVVRLKGAFDTLTPGDENVVTIGAGCSLSRAVQWSGQAGRTGLEWAAGIPGTVGGALVGNAGAYGEAMADSVIDIEAIDEEGRAVTIGVTEAGFGYHTSTLAEGGRIVTSARLRLGPGDGEAIRARIAELIETRRRKLPPGKTAGSIFRNPPGASAGRLLESCGLKGAREGGLKVSNKHANVIVNEGGATAEDLKRLIARMADEVEARFGVRLTPEVRIIGDCHPPITPPNF